MNRRDFCIVFGSLATLPGVVGQNSFAGETPALRRNSPLCFSGIYPHLAQFNQEGECGTGAVVPWAGRLWTVSYGPHCPYGGSDKLYEIDENLNQTIRPESIGGTHANRMIHRESNQLIIGPYLIDEHRNIRVISFKDMPGRLTGTARHLTDPVHKIYFATMEEGFYEVDLETLSVTELYPDANGKRKFDILPGYHGKGFYNGQGRLIYSNNGEQTEEARRNPTVEAGALGTWDGKGTGPENWTLVRRNQFTEVTGPNGIYGAGESDSAPVWSLGWDDKSVILMLLENGEWTSYRLPKASHCYDGAHGWNTEWPRIREVNKDGQSVLPDGGLLMTMHGSFWNFPKTFSQNNTAGIKPLSTYLKVIGDFCFWKDCIVCGCDDSAKSEFLNKSPFKGKLQAPGQSNSNLWFVKPEQIDKFGPALGRGAVWKSESVKANVPSDPYLIAGFDYKGAWACLGTRDQGLGIRGENSQTLIPNPQSPIPSLTFQLDLNGTNQWTDWKTVQLDKSTFIDLSDAPSAQWIRVVSDTNLENVTVEFQYRNKDTRPTTSNEKFIGLATKDSKSWIASTLWGAVKGGWLNIVSQPIIDGVKQEKGFYHLNVDGTLTHETDGEQSRIKIVEGNALVEPVPESIFKIDDKSVLLTYKGQRYRLPIRVAGITQEKDGMPLRLDREVATERDLFNCAGTFYELPAANAGSVPKIRPIASHDFVISDYCSWRGLLILGGMENGVRSEELGVRSDAKRSSEGIENNGFASSCGSTSTPHSSLLTPNLNSNHIIISSDGKAAVWVGAIDDLWELGKPTGFGYVWKESAVTANDVSDAFLATGYDKKTVEIINHDSKAVTITVQADATGDGLWLDYQTFTVESGKNTIHEFPIVLGAYWFRAKASTDSCVSVKFEYR